MPAIHMDGNVSNNAGDESASGSGEVIPMACKLGAQSHLKEKPSSTMNRYETPKEEMSK
jgi:hypothetical protein